MKLKKGLPKLHLSCEKDGYRPIGGYVLITKEHIVSTNFHLIAKYNTSSIFDNVIISNLPDRSLLHSDNWKYLTKPHLDVGVIDDNIIIYYKNSQLLLPLVKEHENLKYPNYLPIFEAYHKEQLDTVSMSSDFINIAGLVMNTKRLVFNLSQENNGIKITSPENKDCECLIMPMVITH